MHPKVLIVGTVPYNTKSTSRAFDAYFHYWEKENIAQIFSNTKKPCKGHCGTLYQITDHQMLNCWIKPGHEPGRIFTYDELKEQWNDNDLEVGSGVVAKAYQLGRKHTPLTHLLRGVLWRHCFWCTNQLNQWLEAFKPECIFLAFSDDYFINQIAIYVAEKFDIPIVSCIGDDYYFNKHNSFNLLYHLYKETYKKLIRRVLSHRGSAIYISDKIRDKYNGYFGLDGETVYLTSNIQRKPFKVIDKANPIITYFGNIGIGRNKSLRAVAEALGQINPEYQLEIYTNETDAELVKVINNHPNIVYGGSIPYTEVMERMKKSDLTVIVEGFEEHEVEFSRYSLSTKAADALASGVAILAYGSAECGIIEYMQSTQAAEVCTDNDLLVESITRIIENEQLQKQYYDKQIEVTDKNHTLRASCDVAENVISRALQKK